MSWSGKRPERVTREQWREGVPTVAGMLKGGWRVFGRCDGCGSTIVLQLDRVAELFGPSFELWDQRPPCPACGSRLALHGQPRGVQKPFPL